MAEYHRILSYLYRYDRKQKMDCKGFVKAEQKSDGIKMTVQIVDERLMENTKLLLCVYTREGESWKLIPIDTLTVSQGREEHIIICKKEQLAEKFEIRNQYGVLLFWQNSFSYPYAKVAMQKEVSSGETLKKEEKRKIGEEGILCETFPCYGSVWIGDEIPLESLMEKKIFPKNVEKEDKKEESDGEKSENVYDGIEKREDGEKKKEEEEKEIREKGEDKVAKKNEEERQRAAAQKGNEEKCGDSTEKRECEEGKGKEKKEEDEGKCGEDAEKKECEEGKGKEEKKEEDEGKCGEDAEKKECEEGWEKEEKEESDIEKAEVEKPLPQKKDTFFEKMWIELQEKGRKVDNIFNPAFGQGVQITIEQLEMLPPEERELANNQFLKNGYRIYQHLLAGKVRYGGEERYCVGVPGIYGNRERYMAQIYQFPLFLSMTENRIKTGGFGYWLHLLSAQSNE